MVAGFSLGQNASSSIFQASITLAPHIPPIAYGNGPDGNKTVPTKRLARGFLPKEHSFNRFRRGLDYCQ
jgi:hypothetical protein